MGITTALCLQWVVSYSLTVLQSYSQIIMSSALVLSLLAAVATAHPVAEAGPDAGVLYGAYGYGHPGYGLAYAGYRYGHGHGLGGYGLVSPSSSLHIGGLAHPALPAVAGGYADAGRYVANSAGVVHVAKREAEEGSEPEPEPESEPEAED